MQNWKIYFVKIWDHEWRREKRNGGESIKMMQWMFGVHHWNFNIGCSIKNFILYVRMDKKEAEKLSEELGKLSENEKQNIKRMKEIAHVLVQYYMWKKKK